MNFFAESLSLMQHSVTSQRCSQITNLNITKIRHCKRRRCCRHSNFFPSRVTPPNTGAHTASVHSRKLPSWSQPVVEIPANPKYVKNSNFRNLVSALKYAPIFVYSVTPTTRFDKLMLNSGEEMKQVLSYCTYHF